MEKVSISTALRIAGVIGLHAVMLVSFFSLSLSLPSCPSLVPLPDPSLMSASHALRFQTGCPGTLGSHPCFRLTCSHEVLESGSRQRILQESLIAQA